MEKKKTKEKNKIKNHIQVNNDKRHTMGDMTSEWSIKCPLGSIVLEKGEREKEEQKHKKENTLFSFVRNVLLYIQWQSQLLLSNTRARKQLHFSVVDQ